MLSGPDGEPADHPVLIDKDFRQMVGFEYGPTGGASEVALQHFESDWVVDLDGVHPSATARVAGVGSGTEARVLLADSPATAGGVYVFTEDLHNWSQGPAPINPTGLAMERPRLASCFYEDTTYLAFQAGQDVYVEQSAAGGAWTLTAGGKVPLPEGTADVRLAELFCTRDNGVSRPFLILEATPSGATHRAILTYELGFDADLNDTWRADASITAAAGLDAVNPVVSGAGGSLHLAFVVPGAEAGLDRIQVMDFDRSNDRWNPIGGYLNAVDGHSPGPPRIVEARGPVVAFTESDGTSQALYTLTWDGAGWVPYDEPLRAASGDSLAIVGNDFGLAADFDGDVELAYPEDTPDGRRIRVEHCYHPTED
jgi:hypothetical protein